ncbi:hypothetical protein EV401DRAFT_2079134 [Pisolithus croceorrhizus]|nr:hypothetical protein EV401DRAFT_2079134 [Pisolithus croceorrhizus]
MESTAHWLVLYTAVPDPHLYLYSRDSQISPPPPASSKPWIEPIYSKNSVSYYGDNNTVGKYQPPWFTNVVIDSIAFADVSPHSVSQDGTYCAWESTIAKPTSLPLTSSTKPTQCSQYEVDAQALMFSAQIPQIEGLSGNFCDDSAPVASLLGCVTGENRALSIIKDFCLVDHARGYWDTQGHTSNCITNHDTTLPPSYTRPLPPYAIEQSSGYPQESGNISTCVDLDSSFSGPSMCLGPIPSSHHCTSGQVIGSDAPSSWLSSPLFPSLQGLHPSDDLTIGDNPLPPEQSQVEIAVPSQFLSSFTAQLTTQICPRTPSPYTYPNPSQSDSTSYSISDDYISSCPSFPMLNRTSSSWSLQEHLGYPLPVHPRYTRSADLPDLQSSDAGGEMELHTRGILNDRTAQLLNDDPSWTVSEYETHPSRNHSTPMPEDDSAGGGVDHYGNFDKNKFNSEQIVGVRPQLLRPPNQFPLPSHELHSCDCMSRIEDRSLTGAKCHTHRPTAQSRVMTGLPKARSVCDRNVSNFCGWRDDKGRKCGIPISYGDCAGHFAASHDIKDIAWNVRLICRWCFSEPQKEIVRKNLLRHLREVHLCCPRSENGT